MNQVVDAHLQTCYQVQPHGPPLHRLLLGGTLAQGIAAGCRRAASRWRSLACWIPIRRRPKTGRDAGRQRVEGGAARARAVPGGVAGYARSGAGRDAHRDVRQH
ncbi:hypothetical protein M8494_35975 [Serratia ureilytica]